MEVSNAQETACSNRYSENFELTKYDWPNLHPREAKFMLNLIAITWVWFYSKEYILPSLFTVLAPFSRQTKGTLFFLYSALFGVFEPFDNLLLQIVANLLYCINQTANAIAVMAAVALNLNLIKKKLNKLSVAVFYRHFLTLSSNTFLRKN